jgi:hypothetical protein
VLAKHRAADPSVVDLDTTKLLRCDVLTQQQEPAPNHKVEHPSSIKCKEYNAQKLLCDNLMTRMPLIINARLGINYNISRACNYAKSISTYRFLLPIDGT